jgi:hypothetical protein
LGREKQVAGKKPQTKLVRVGPIVDAWHDWDGTVIKLEDNGIRTNLRFTGPSHLSEFAQSLLEHAERLKKDL